MQRDNNPKTAKKIAIFSGIGVQLGLTIYLASFLGGYLDQQWSLRKPWMTLLFILLAIVATIYALLKQLKRLDDV